MKPSELKGRLLYKYLYDSPRWKRLRRAQLNKEPLCKFCEEKGVIEQATIVDHIIRHKGDKAKFYDSSNLQSLCKLCHDQEKKIMENREDWHPVGVDGWPSDPDHHFNR